MFITFFCFFFNDTATTEIYTLSLHDALPISRGAPGAVAALHRRVPRGAQRGGGAGDRKSTRLNSSHPSISYAVFCLKKKKNLIILLLLTEKKYDPIPDSYHNSPFNSISLHLL